MKNLSLVIVISAIFFSHVLHAKGIASENHTSINHVIAAYAKNTQTKVVASDDVKGSVQLYGLSLNEINFDILLSSLKLKGYNAYQSNEHLVIIPDHQARIHITQQINEEVNPTPEQHLTKIISLQNICAESLMPILKPIVHMHSYIQPIENPNAVIIIDSHRSITRVENIIHTLDSKAKKQSKCNKIDYRIPNKKASK